MIVLDYQDRRPLYEQVTEKFRTLIYQGALPADSRLPSVRQLAIELSINPKHDPESVYDAGAGRTDLSDERQGEFRGRHTEDTGKIQRRFRSEFLELVKRGCRSGFEEKELLTLVQRGYKEEQK